MTATCKHATLTANTVYTVTLTRGDSYWVSVTDRSRLGEIYFTIDGSTPTVLGDNSYLVIGYRAFRTPATAEVTVKLISTAALDFSVELFA